MVDVLAFGAHPDDIEIFMGGAASAIVHAGLKVGICDLTRGEAGTYGLPEERKQEAELAAELLGIQHRKTLSFTDGFINDSKEIVDAVVDQIRQFKPRVVFSFTGDVRRHPDHRETGKLVQKCCFIAGLEKIRTEYPPHRPEHLYQFPELIIWDRPDFVIDITDYWDNKIKAIEAYSSQVLKKGESDQESKTFIKSADFWKILESRGRQAGAMIGTEFGEPFYSAGTVSVPATLGLL